MQFDPQRKQPRLIHPDEPPLSADGELNLPDDLAAIAAQLAGDAKALSAHYPADRQQHAAIAAQLVGSAERIGAASQRRSSWRRWALVAGGGLASVAAAVATVSLAMRTGGDNAPPRFAATTPSLATAPRAANSAAAAPASLSPMGPSLSLGELSAPEMEAVFDLLQNDAKGATSISF
jgi:hypothetical protein